MLRRLVKRVLPQPLVRRYERELRKETHINRALASFSGETRYIEIGVRDGACIREITASQKYAIDPFPVGAEKIASDGTELYQVTSDIFFSEVTKSTFRGRSVHVALVDGLHEFEQTLRDILNLERLMVPAGVIFVHDCNPPTRRHAEDVNGPWNGDVWKVAEYIRRCRKDLTFFTLDCDWGLGVVTSVSPSPPTPDDRAIRETSRLDFSYLDANRSNVLNLKSPLYSRFFFRKHRSPTL
jgi:hypothetical protein